MPSSSLGRFKLSGKYPGSDKKVLARKRVVYVPKYDRVIKSSNLMGS